jgi:hypothetical protein
MSLSNRINRVAMVLLAPAALLVPAAVASAVTNTVDFENVPGGNVEGMNISDQYKPSTGISFEYEDGSFPVLVREKPAVVTTEPLPLGFWNHHHEYTDHVVDGQDVGNWFVARGFPEPPPVLDVNFDKPVAGAGGEILDIDRKKAWEIDAYSPTDTLVGSITLMSHTDGTGDGIATPWSFSNIDGGISTIKISYVGGNKKMGFGMDNFYTVSQVQAGPLPSTAAVPLPPAAWSGLAGLLGLGMIGLIRRGMPKMA